MMKLGMWLTVVMMTCCNITFAQADTATETFNKLRSRLNAIKDYTADVRVKIDVSFMKVPPLVGKLYFKAPDKMKLERNGGISILPKKNMNMSLNSMLPSGSATVIDAGKDIINGRNVRVLKVIPQEESDIVLTKIWVDYERNLALRTETTTRDNGTVKMDLSFGNYIKQGLPDKITVHLDVKEFKLPKGVTMDYDSQQPVKAAPAASGKNKKGTIEINYLNYQVNKGLADSIFEEKR